MPPRSLPAEFLRSVFELLKHHESTAWSVSQVCKQWRQAAIDSPSLWSENLYLNPDINVLHQEIIPRIRAHKVQNLILSSSSPVLFWTPSDQMRPRTPVVDPHLITKLTLTLPALLPRIRNLKLEVPSSSWYMLEQLFKNDVSHLEKLELRRLDAGTKPESSRINDYTSATFNWALKNATLPWKLRSLHLHGCTLDLAPCLAFATLEELSLFNLPAAASFTPHEVIAFLRGLPQLKRLQLTWATKWNLGYLQRFGEPMMMHSLESIAITAKVDHCSFIFTSLSLLPKCKVQIMVTDVSSTSAKSGNSFVEKHLVAIADRHKQNGGSPYTKVASLQVKSGTCGLQSLDSNLPEAQANDKSTCASSPSFVLVLFIDESSTITSLALGRRPESIDRFFLTNALRKLIRTIFPRMEELRLDLDLGLVYHHHQKEISSSTYYLTQFNISRAEFPGVLRLNLKHPYGEFMWPEAQ